MSKLGNYLYKCFIGYYLLFYDIIVRHFLIVGIAILMMGSSSIWLSVSYAQDIEPIHSGEYQLTGNSITTGFDSSEFDISISGSIVDSGTLGSGGVVVTGALDGYMGSSLLSLGSITFSEIFPSSGSCLDEYVVIHSSVDYSGHLEIQGLGTSTSSIFISVDLHSGSTLIVTDNLAGMIPRSDINLVSSVTLTNSGEPLKLFAGGILVDSIVYSNLQGVQSLYHDGGSSYPRVFTVNGVSTPMTTCSNNQIVSWDGGLGGCDIHIDSMIPGNTGSYNLSLRIVGQHTIDCQTYSMINTHKWLLNGNNMSDKCNSTITAEPGINDIVYEQVSSTGMLICRDQLVFASSLIVDTIKEQLGGLCGNSNSGGPSISQQPLIYPSTRCGIQLQGSWKAGFGFGNTINIVSLFGDHSLSDSQTKFRCTIDMGDGVTLYECNPSSYRYIKPGVYPIVLSIYSSDNQLVCGATSFINVPLIKSSTLMLLEEADYEGFICLSDTIDKLGDDEDDILSGKVASKKEYNKLSDKTGICLTNMYDAHVSMLLANPIGSDSDSEMIIVSGNRTSFNELPESLYLHIGKKTIRLGSHSFSGYISGNNLTLIGGLGLINKGMCLSLGDSTCGIIQTVCYDQLHESEWVRFDYGTGVYSEDFLSGVMTGTIVQGSISVDRTDKNASSKNPVLSCTEKIRIAKEKQKISYEKKIIGYQKRIVALTLKEKIARNNYYLYSNVFSYLTNRLKKTVLPEWLTSLNSVTKYLEGLIKQGYFYTLKDTKNGSYRYTNGVTSLINQGVFQQSLVVPSLTTYLWEVRSYQTNATTVVLNPNHSIPTNSSSNSGFLLHDY
ncbi:MAG TPA: hypothetical protein PK048_02815 [Candidatus Absconditabacterales bacterium]|nr:hypothetical protein [Candidatus Absconditabacterales bacterium]